MMNSVSLRSSAAFTLLELMTVVVVIAILSSLSLGFIINSVEGYQDNVARGQLTATGRQTIERVTRELRQAVPGSLRVSTNNLCIEWLPSIAGGFYVQDLPDQNNGAAPTNTIAVAPLNFSSGTPGYVAVAAFSNTEVYGASPGSLALYSSINDSTVPNIITLAANKQFLRNSLGRRLYIAESPKQLCIANGELRLHRGYTTAGSFPSSLLSGSPPNVGMLLAEGVSPTVETPFSLSLATEDRNVVVSLEIPFSRNGETVVIEHQLMVRNVP